MTPHSKLAEQLAALMAYRNRPAEEVEPLQSNWTVVPANDNASVEEIADFSFERHLRMTPSVQEIMRHVAEGPIERNGDGQIVAIGKLKFSDGHKMEKAFKRGPDGDVIEYDREMPVGAMLRMREKAEGPAGGKGYNSADMENSDKFFASVFGTSMPRYIKRTDRRNGPSLTADQSRTMIAEAIANTPVMPPVTYCPPGLPCGSNRLADSFVSFKKVCTGQSGSVAWEDIGQTIENAKVWKNLSRALKTKDRDVLDAAMAAQSYADVGIAAGLSPSYSDKKGGGRRALFAANDNLAAALRKFAS